MLAFYHYDETSEINNLEENILFWLVVPQLLFHDHLALVALGSTVNLLGHMVKGACSPSRDWKTNKGG